MSTLLATQRIPLRAHLFEHVTIADSGRYHVDAVLLHGDPEAKVGHHGGDHRVACECAAITHPQRKDRQDLVAIDDVAVGIDGKAPVSIAVVGDADVSSVLEHSGDEIVQVRASTALVDVQAVRRGMDCHHVGTGSAHRLGGHSRRRAIGAVDHDGQSLEGRPHDVEHMIEVVLRGRRQRADTAHSSAQWAIPWFMKPGLDGVLDGIRQLESMGVEELDAVVRHRVVRGRQHHAETRSVTLREIGDGRSGKHAGEEYVDSRAGEACHDRGFEEFATRARIAPDDGRGSAAVYRQRPCVAQHVGRRSGEGQGKLGGEVAVGESPHAIGAKEATAHGAPISACCTEAPCGPS